MGTDNVILITEDIKRIDELAPCGVAAGEPYPAALMGSINR